MSAQLWKRDDEDARVTFRCPWCEVVGVSPVYGRYEQRPRVKDRGAPSSGTEGPAIWLLAGCPNVPCGRGVLIKVPSQSAWAQLDTGDDGLLLAPSCVYPRE